MIPEAPSLISRVAIFQEAGSLPSAMSSAHEHCSAEN
jgi:hypothetical protein